MRQKTAEKIGLKVGFRTGPRRPQMIQIRCSRVVRGWGIRWVAVRKVGDRSGPGV